MARVAVNRANVTSGVIDPLMWDRFDVAQWHNALSDGVNLTILPQGGFRRRDGARTRSRLRRVLTPISWADAVFTAPNGGTTSAAIDGNTATEFRTTATVVAGTPLTVFEIALPQPVSLAAVDLTGFACQLLTADAALGLEVSNDGITWALFGRRVNVRTVAHNRRFANAPGIATVARFVRVSVVSAQALGTIGFKDLALWTGLTLCWMVAARSCWSRPTATSMCSTRASGRQRWRFRTAPISYPPSHGRSVMPC
jgi:hypothetical protein